MGYCVDDGGREERNRWIIDKIQLILSFRLVTENIADHSKFLGKI
jgi:hypothetical protein